MTLEGAPRDHRPWPRGFSPGHSASPPPAGHPPSDRQPLWLYVVVIIGALGVLSLAYSALFSPATMLTSGQQLSISARTWAHYSAPTSSRSVSPCSCRWRSTPGGCSTGILVQAAFAEVMLGVVAIATHRWWDQVAADVVLIAAFLLCARWLHRSLQKLLRSGARGSSAAVSFAHIQVAGSPGAGRGGQS